MKGDLKRAKSEIAMSKSNLSEWPTRAALGGEGAKSPSRHCILFIMRKKTPIWEDAVIILSIFTLWPTVIRRETPLSRIVMIAALCLLVWIFVRRIRRMNNTPQ